MDDQMNQGASGMPAAPVMPSPTMGGITPPPPPMGGMVQEDPHEKIMASLARIEEKLAAIAVKVGA